MLAMLALYPPLLPLESASLSSQIHRDCVPIRSLTARRAKQPAADPAFHGMTAPMHRISR